MQPIKQAVQEAVKTLFGIEVEPIITLPEEKFGDYTTSVALKIAGQLNRDSRVIAKDLAKFIEESGHNSITKIEIAGPGFINFSISDEALWNEAQRQIAQPLKGKTVVAEYSDPNPFKVLHAGHLYTSLVGDTVAKLLEKAGAIVHRVNFGGDVGRHVAQAMWSILKELGGEHPDKLADLKEDEKLGWIGARYVAGTTAYQTDETAKNEIIELNKRIYDIHSNNDHSSPLAQIYWTCRQWSYDGFDALYKRLEMDAFDKYYPESEVFELGLEKIRQHIGTVYEKSDNAIIFRGEKYGLFTQVFINSQGLPTYAGKDVGLIYKKYEDFAPDVSFIFTDVAQKEHLSVVMKSIEQYEPKLVAATIHFTHGQIKMAGGVKMSSRKGNVLLADDILDAAQKASQALSGKTDVKVILAAVKYAFLRNRIGGHIVYDPKESVSLEGNSGPYLQYAHARARSILAKSSLKPHIGEITLDASERNLVRKLSEYPDTLEKATNDLLPHYICNYLYELSQKFNQFYEKNRVLGDERESLRLKLVEQYANTLQSGLELLNISAPARI